jgi:hypothetical protein
LGSSLDYCRTIYKKKEARRHDGHFASICHSLAFALRVTGARVDRPRGEPLLRQDLSYFQPLDSLAWA